MGLENNTNTYEGDTMSKPETLTPNLSRKNKWWISKHSYYAAYHFAMKYGEWKDEYKNLDNTLSSPGYDNMPHGSGISRPTEDDGIKKAELKTKINLIEDTVKETDGDMYKWLLRAVTKEGCTYNYLRKVMKMPYGRNTFYDRRRKFYYILSKKIC